MASVNTADKSLPQCKKCGDSHDKPINNKCERVKHKEEKRDTSRETSTRKTPKSKVTNEISQEDRVLDLVMNTMSTFTDKLSAMEAKISGLSSRMDNVPYGQCAENLSWPIARGAFAVAMHRVEDENTTWADTRFLAENRLTYFQTVVFNGSITLSPRPAQNNQLPSLKRVVCRWYNEGTCPHSQDHKRLQWCHHLSAHMLILF